MLENQVKTNQKRHMEMVEKISSLYERLRLDVSDKYKFLSVNQVIRVLSSFSLLLTNLFRATVNLSSRSFNLKSIGWRN